MNIKPLQPTGTLAVSSSNETQEEKNRENRREKNRKTLKLVPKQPADSVQLDENSTIASQPVDTAKMLELLAQRTQEHSASVPHYVPKTPAAPIPSPKAKLGKAF